jgi:hypothetical protein
VAAGQLASGMRLRQCDHGTESFTAEGHRNVPEFGGLSLLRYRQYTFRGKRQRTQRDLQRAAAAIYFEFSMHFRHVSRRTELARQSHRYLQISSLILKYIRRYAVPEYGWVLPVLQNVVRMTLRAFVPSSLYKRARFELRQERVNSWRNA